MIGFVYLGWAIISHLGYSVKQFVHDVNVQVDKRSGTYIGYDGREYLVGTKKHVFWTHNNDGDEVLWDRPGHVYRNISEEQRQKEFQYLKENRNGATAYKTKQIKRIAYRNPVMNRIDRQEAMVYLDLDTGTEYVCVDCLVNLEEKKEFYAKLLNPYMLVRMSDNQRQFEKMLKKHYKPNWIDSPNKEKEFIKNHNSGPYPPAGIITFKRS